jgi:hypothetical protein
MPAQGAGCVKKRFGSSQHDMHCITNATTSATQSMAFFVVGVRRRRYRHIFVSVSVLLMKLSFRSVSKVLLTMLKHFLISRAGKNSDYGLQLTWADLAAEPHSSVSAIFWHFANGPSIELECHKYIPRSGHEGLLFYKTNSGWASMDTATYALGSNGRRCIQEYLSKYVSSYVTYFQRQMPHSSWLTEILRHAYKNIKVRSTQRIPC